MEGRKITKCTQENFASTSLPVIAIMAATTSRKIKNPSPSRLSLFIFLLPSLMRSVDCGFRYVYVLGYDAGDPYYDTVDGMRTSMDWFTEHVQNVMESYGISLTMKTVRVNNTLKKPGPVFIEMARAAYNMGAEYLYRINDDSEMEENWPNIFVKAIDSLPSKIGVVGPTCLEGNKNILTHDFVHRVHMEIFEMNYYPPELVDWWMDDWISFVYGVSKSFKSSEVKIVHHVGAHGTRYEVEMSNGNKLGTAFSFILFISRRQTTHTQNKIKTSGKQQRL
jgi:hypothetical protein